MESFTLVKKNSSGAVACISTGLATTAFTPVTASSRSKGPCWTLVSAARAAAMESGRARIS
jgi:hypothetical protein